MAREDNRTPTPDQDRTPTPDQGGGEKSPEAIAYAHGLKIGDFVSVTRTKKDSQGNPVLDDKGNLQLEEDYDHGWRVSGFYRENGRARVLVTKGDKTKNYTVEQLAGYQEGARALDSARGAQAHLQALQEGRYEPKKDLGQHLTARDKEIIALAGVDIKTPIEFDSVEEAKKWVRYKKLGVEFKNELTPADLIRKKGRYIGGEVRIRIKSTGEEYGFRVRAYDNQGKNYTFESATGKNVMENLLFMREALLEG